MKAEKIKIEPIGVDEFPEGLSEIPEPPERLFVAGTIPPKEACYLAVVGSRRFTDYGKSACEKIVGALAGTGIVIVSGLALGIDAIAHESALRAGLTTIAFPGSGLSPDVLYPRSHLGLAHEIISKGGALVSEFPNDFKATPYSFPQRNRLMAGISRGILVIEAEERSGTLITARLGTEYNRDVFAVPGSIFSYGSAGTNRLLKDGAIPATSGADILKHWNLAAETNQARLPDLTAEEAKILEALGEPVSKDELIQALNLSAHELNIALGTLELKGVITESMGKIRRIS